MILVLRHEPFEHLGFFDKILRDARRGFTYRDLGEPLSLNGCTGIIIMGGPQSANDPDPALAAEVRLIQEAIARRLPVLGICLGSQLIAKALGAAVYKNPAKEIGWEAVYFTEAAVGDPLFGGVASPTVFFHWHGETFDLPDGAVWLAYSPKCRHQAFRYGANVYGIQFHPEITPEMIVDWSSQPANCGDVEMLAAPINPYEADTSELAKRILDGWLALSKPIEHAGVTTAP